MQNVFRRVRQLQLALSRRHESLLLQGVGPTLDAYKPVYERTPPWSARWTYPIIFAQIGVSCALTELILHHWTELKTPPPDESTNGTTTTTPREPEYVLRPLYQRASAVLGQFCASAFVCILLLNSRARIVRRLYVLPGSSLTPTALSPVLSPSLSSSSPAAGKSRPKAGSKTSKHPHKPQGGEQGRVLVAQNVYHFRGQGNVFAFDRTRLVQGFGANELAFEVDGRRGRFYLGLDGARVNGEQMDGWKAREALFRVWYGAKGKGEMSKYNWVS